MNIRKTSLAVLGAALVTISGGCMRSRPRTLYTLKGPGAAGQELPLEIRNLELPEYLDGFSIMKRQGDNRVLPVRGVQWVQNLRSMMIAYMRDQFPAGQTGSGKYAILDFKHFEADSDGNFNTELVCKIKDRMTGEFRTERISFQLKWDGKDNDKLAALHEEALQIAAEKLANLLKE